jgi:hypothetical protein
MSVRTVEIFSRTAGGSASTALTDLVASHADAKIAA